MNPDVLQFQCSACQSVLTVPSHMAGVTGPCPICGQTITSPSAPPPSAPVSLFTTPLPSHQPQSVPPSAPGPVMPMPHSTAQHLSPMGNQSPAQGEVFSAIIHPPQRSNRPHPGSSQALGKHYSGACHRFNNRHRSRQPKVCHPQDPKDHHLFRQPRINP